MRLEGFNKLLPKEKMQFPENRDLVRLLGADSMVLLKNNNMLPMNKGKIALFGAGSVDTMFCGVYFNYVFTDKTVNVRDGLVNNGFILTTDSWLGKMEKAVKQGTKKEFNESKNGNSYVGDRCDVSEVPISVADMAEAILGTDTCIYVVRHGVGSNNVPNDGENEYQLTEVELANLQLITSSFKNVILVLNCPMIELSSIARMKPVKAIILMGIPGMEAGNSLADILTGAINPSGRLTSTWAKKYKDYSTCYSSKSSKNKKNEIEYKEGIYVGYRYFDTFDVTPLFPFGYGLSYTTFDMDLTYIEASWITVMLRIKVTNTGSVSGRQVVQIYCSQPQGKLDKPYQFLTGFGKTGKLKPGESEEVTIKIPIMALCSFDEELTAWVMEKGDYVFRVGDNSRSTKLAAKVVLDRLTVIKKVAKVIEPDRKLEFLVPPSRQEEDTGYIMVASLSADDYNSENKMVALKKEMTTYVQEGSNYNSYINDAKYQMPEPAHENIEYVKPCGSATYFDVVKDKISLEEFVSSLSPEVLARIVAGIVDESKFENESRLRFNFSSRKKKYRITARTTSQFETTLGIPSVAFADGPSGLRIENVPCTCFPSPMNMGQTWDFSATVRMGRAVGREMELYGIDYLLAPPLNIVRNPMRNRAYEFYSEDPNISGMLGAGFVMGIKRYEGRDVVMKNLATYNQETARADVNIVVSRRTFGEIYLRPFSVCQFVIKPAGALNSGNRINGAYTSSRRGLNTDIIRSDWGFNGFVLSDWGSISEKPYDLHAGCDLIMPGYDPDKILEAMMDVEPTFAKDGYVEVVAKDPVYGEPMIIYEKWGSFILDKNGEETRVAKVEANHDLNKGVQELCQQGYCQIIEELDGTKTIIYKGTNRGPYLPLGDLQQAVIHILSVIKDSAAMKELLAKANI